MSEKKTETCVFCDGTISIQVICGGNDCSCTCHEKLGHTLCGIGGCTEVATRRLVLRRGIVYNVCDDQEHFNTSMKRIRATHAGLMQPYRYGCPNAGG